MKRKPIKFKISSYSIAGWSAILGNSLPAGDELGNTTPQGTSVLKFILSIAGREV